MIRFRLDEDQSPDVAVTARKFGIDITTTAEARLFGKPDAVQLAHAASEGRALISKNYPDFIRLTEEFEARQLPHAGVLFVPESMENYHYYQIAEAIAAYARNYPDGMPPYMVDYLRPVRH
jgi:hypothetical protein